MDHPTIEVKFYEGQSEAPFAVSNVPVEQLPDTFEIDTVLHLGDQDWRVLDAKPAQKSVFRQEGGLELYLARHEVSQVNPNDILYSMSTINDELAGVEAAESLEGVVVLHEDDWRQVEFLTHSHESLIEAELLEIMAIYEHHRVGGGFNKLHLRSKITAPLEGVSLTVDALEQHFTIAKKYEGVAFNTAAATVVGGFALQTASGWLFWGQVNPSGTMTSLSLAQTSEASVTEMAPKMDAFLEGMALYLVDWPRLFWCGKDLLSFLAYAS